jgi:hypothetical protein
MNAAASAPPSSDPGRRPPKLSEILDDIAADTDRDRISVGDLLRAMESRAFGVLLLVFAFPNMLPTPPGTSGVLGLPLLFLSAQMMLGQSPWLPDFIARRSMTRDSFATLVGHAGPWLQRAERLLRARMLPLGHPAVQRVIGGLCLLLSMLLALPIPFANMAPAFALCIISLGVLERDGVWMILGTLTALAAVIFSVGMAYAVVKSALFVFFNAF